MVMVTVLYPKTRESHFDFGYYLHHHIPLVDGHAFLKEVGET